MIAADKGEVRRVTPNRARSRARRCAVQALYQWQLTGQDPAEIEAQFLDEQDMGQVDVEYFRELLHQVVGRQAALDEALAPHLDRPIHEVDPVERAVLRLGAYELACRLDIPYRVVIDEAVELAKRFGAEQGHRFVNGVLDQAARKLRAVEVQAKR